MHYYIDGYNLLFRLTDDKENLQSERQALIYDLNKKISAVKWNASLIFDATFQLGGRDRSHFDALEILFTAFGETADEYILDELSRIRYPNQETVVTSDKRLAWKVRHLGAHTESVEDFFDRLNRSYKNKTGPLKSKKKSSLPELSKSVPSPSPILNMPAIDASVSEYSDYYLQVFETKWQNLNQQQEAAKRLKKSQQPTKRQPRQRSSSFLLSKAPEIQAQTDAERWLKVFETPDVHPPQFPNT
jgi:uncharacterized protein